MKPIRAEPHWAILDDDLALLDSASREKTSVEKMVERAKESGANPTVEVETHDIPVEDFGRLPVSTPNPVSLLRKEPARALGLTGLPKIDHAEVMGLGLEEAHARIERFFPKTRTSKAGVVEQVAVWTDPKSMAGAFLTVNYKTSKRIEGAPMFARGLSLLPYDRAFQTAVFAGKTLCAFSTFECRQACLVFSGQNQVEEYNNAVKRAKSHALLTDPVAFCRVLYEGVVRLDRSSERPFVRLNVYSDIPWELFWPELFESFKSLQFYDYTKVPGRKLPKNYDLTFSFSGTPANLKHVESEIDSGRRIAVVFLRKPKRKNRPAETFPEKFLGLKVIDGDLYDFRPIDPAPSIVGLHYKPPKRSVVAETLRGGEQARPKRFVVPCYMIDGVLVATEAGRQTPGVPDPEVGLG